MERGSVQSVEQEVWHPGPVFTPDRKHRSHSINSSKHNYSSHPSFVEELNLKEESSARRVPYFRSALFCAVLEDTLVELRCLEQCNNHLKIIKTNADVKHLTAIKFGMKVPAVTDELEGIDRNDLNNTIYKIRKLDADRKAVTDVMLKLYLELTFHSTYFSLPDYNQQRVAVYVYRDDLERDEEKNKIIRRDLAKQVRQQRNHFKSAIYDSEVTIDNLKSNVEDSLQVSETGSRYVGNWEIARTEQHLKTIENVEGGPLSNIMYYKQRYEHEVRVHNEVELVVNIVINETLTKVEGLMDKYDQDTEHLDMKIELKKHEYYDACNKRKEMQATLEKHDKLMKDWILFKEEREKLRLYKLKMTKAAIVVQAWWRGLLVRCNLGPFKIKKKKKEKKK